MVRGPRGAAPARPGQAADRPGLTRLSVIALGLDLQALGRVLVGDGGGFLMAWAESPPADQDPRPRSRRTAEMPRTGGPNPDPIGTVFAYIDSMAERHDRGTGGPALPVLMFHALEEGPAVISFPPRVFRQGLARLRAEGYRSVPLAEAVASLRRGAPLPERAVVITFDDGYRSVYEEAFPTLQEHGMTATVFLTVGRPGAASSSSGRLPDFAGRPMLGWAEIRAMHRAGMAIGAHTLTHPDLTRLSPEEAEVEMRDSRAAIEDAVGASVESFAYPYGRYDGRSRELARRYFACACSDRLGLVRSDSDPYALERVETYYLRTHRLFRLMPSRWFPWYLRARSLPRTTRQLAWRAAGGT